MKTLIDWLKIQFWHDEYTKCFFCKKVIKKNNKSDSAVWYFKQYCNSCDDRLGGMI